MGMVGLINKLLNKLGCFIFAFTTIISSCTLPYPMCHFHVCLNPNCLVKIIGFEESKGAVTVSLGVYSNDAVREAMKEGLKDG